MAFIETFPEELELSVLFESEPIFKEVRDIHYAYSYRDSSGLELIFSFFAPAGWIQAVLMLDGREISRCLTEGVKSFGIINGDSLKAEVVFEDAVTSLEVKLKPFISIAWDNLLR